MDPYPYGRPREDIGVRKSNPEGINQYSGGGGATHADTQRQAEQHAKNTGSTVTSKQSGDKSSFRFKGPNASQAAHRLATGTHGDRGRRAEVTSSRGNSARVEVQHNTSAVSLEERMPGRSGDHAQGGVFGEGQWGT